MTILEKLTLTDKTRADMTISPEAKVRGKMLEALDIQIAAAEAQAAGETYIRRAKRWVTDPENGERVRKEIPVRFNSWCWTDENGKAYVQLRYGNKPLELKNGKSTIQLDSQEALLPTLKDLRAAIVDGELDKVLMAAKKDRAGSWKRAKK